MLGSLVGDAARLDMGQDAAGYTIMVDIDQLYGIEINDFAVSVAKAALWIAESQMMTETQEILYRRFDYLPLSANANIVEADALTMDWADVIQPDKLTYITSNPPFNGARTMTAMQKAELKDVTRDVRKNFDLDYVCGWYVKSADMMDRNSRIAAALVSTNSICQGVQAGNLWSYLVKDRGIEIGFAHRTFIWNNEASEMAHVHCVVVGFAKRGTFSEKTIYEKDTHKDVENVDCYLLPTSDVFVTDRTHPLCDVPEMENGNQPRDDGNLLMTAEERDEILRREPDLERFIRPYFGAVEFLNRRPRYCFWLEDASESDIEGSPILSARVRAVYEFRAGSTAKTTNGYAKTPWLMAQRPQTMGVDFLLIPRVSSENRLYLPMGYMKSGVIASDAAQVLPSASLYEFGVLSSLVHNAWMRVVSGRLESRYRYSIEVTYNCFPWPVPTDSQRAHIESCAQSVLDTRDSYSDVTLRDMYDGISPMPENPNKRDFKRFDNPRFVRLLMAHRELDVAVEEAYGQSFGRDEESIATYLLQRFSELDG